VVNIPASYSGIPRFKSRLGDRLSWLRFLWSSSVPPGQCWGSTSNYITTASFHIISSSSFVQNPFIRPLYSESLKKCRKINFKQTKDIAQHTFFVTIS
jgi:hypothetical protein